MHKIKKTKKRNAHKAYSFVMYTRDQTVRVFHYFITTAGKQSVLLYFYIRFSSLWVGGDEIAKMYLIANAYTCVLVQ